MELSTRRVARASEQPFMEVGGWRCCWRHRHARNQRTLSKAPWAACMRVAEVQSVIRLMHCRSRGLSHLESKVLKLVAMVHADALCSVSLS